MYKVLHLYLSHILVFCVLFSCTLPQDLSDKYEKKLHFLEFFNNDHFSVDQERDLRYFSFFEDVQVTLSQNSDLFNDTLSDQKFFGYGDTKNNTDNYYEFYEYIADAASNPDEKESLITEFIHDVIGDENQDYTIPYFFYYQNYQPNAYGHKISGVFQVVADPQKKIATLRSLFFFIDNDTTDMELIPKELNKNTINRLFLNHNNVAKKGKISFGYEKDHKQTYSKEYDFTNLTNEEKTLINKLGLFRIE